MKIKKSKNHFTSAQAFASFMIVSLMSALFVLYLNAQSTLESTKKQDTFVLLSIVLVGFLIALLYFINNSTSKKTNLATKRSVKSSSAKKPSKKSRRK